MGQTWEERNSGLPKTRSSVFIDPGAAFIVGIVGGGLYRSTDEGISWTDVSAAAPSGEARKACVHQGDAYVYFAGSGVYRSTDDGITWNPTAATGVYYALYSDGSRLYAVTSSSLNFSDDAGASWTTRPLGTQSDRGLAIVQTAGRLLVGHTASGVFTTSDDGLTWTPSSDGLSATQVQAICSTGSAILAGVNDAGLYRSTDAGGTWSQIVVDPDARDIRDILQSGTTVFCGSEDAIHYSTDDGLTWSIASGSAYSIACLSQGGNTMYAGTFQGEILASTDGGMNWALRGDLGTGDDINTLIDNGTVLMASTQGDGIFVSTDGGATWEKRNNGIAGSPSSESLAFSDGVWYSGNSPGFYRSWDNGMNWYPNQNTIRSSSTYRMLAVDGGLVCGTYNHGIYFFDTADSVWTKISEGYGGTAVWDLYQSQGTVYLGSYANGAWMRSVSDLRPEPGMTLAPSSVDFGSVELAKSVTRRVKIFSTGDGTLRVRGYQVSGQDAAAFSLTYSGKEILRAGDSASIDVRFTAAEGRAYSAELVITSNDATAETQRVALAGSGLQSPVIRVVPASYDFGNVETGKELEKTFSIYNDGSAALVIQAPVIEGADAAAFTHSGSPLTIPPNDLYNIAAKFKPTSEGLHEAVLVLPNNDPANPRLEIPLTGTGIKPAEPDIEVDRPSINFPVTDVGSMNAEALRIRNRGGSDLEIYSTSLTGNGSAAFTVRDGGSLTIAPGNYHDLSIEFRPDQNLPYTATLVIQSNDPDVMSYPVLLSGRGTGDTSPEIELGRTSISYGSVPVGGARNESVTVRNVGRDPLVIGGFRLQGVGADQFTFVRADTATLTQDAEMTVIIAFAPTKSGLHRADLIISSNDPVTPNALLTLTGDAVISSAEQPPSLPASVLMQNHPNPATHMTQFPFRLRERTHVRIEVLDLLGRSVRTLRDAVLEAGAHDVRFDVSAMRAGVYLCRMTAGGTVSTRRFIVR